MLKSMFQRSTPSQPLVEQNARAERGSVREKAHTNDVITPETALGVTAVLAAFTILSEDIASLPLSLYRRLKGGGKSRAFDSPYYGLMHDAPNPEHTSMIFREIMMGHLLGWGNFFGQMIWDGTGVVQEIWPLRPDRMQVSRLKGERVYLYRDSDGKPHAFTQDDILHVPAFGFDGLLGYSRIALARNAIGLAMATEKFGEKFFSNDARPGVVLKHPKALKPAAADNILKSWVSVYGGSDNSHKAAILEEGMDLVEIGIPPEDAQFLQTREFQVGEIARIFRVPPHMIGDTNSSTSWGSGIESQEQGYVNHTLRPWMVRIEQILSQQVLLKDERAYLYFEHMVEGLLRGDIAVRYGSYVQAINNGIMSPNEVRARENMNPYEGGDEYYHPLNTGTAAVATPPAAGDIAAGAARKSVFQPLWREAASRVIKRECNDVGGAARRLLARGGEQGFLDWSMQFYDQEQPAFIKKQFGALIDVYKQLNGEDNIELLETYFSEYLGNRLEMLTGKNSESIENELERWAAQGPDEMTDAIMQIIGGTNG